jgi:hypothetical protein
MGVAYVMSCGEDSILRGVEMLGPILCPKLKIHYASQKNAEDKMSVWQIGLHTKPDFSDLVWIEPVNTPEGWEKSCNLMSWGGKNTIEVFKALALLGVHVVDSF